MAEVVDPDTEALDQEGLAALMDEQDQVVSDHYTALRNALLRGHGAVLSDRERSLMTTIVHGLVVDMGEALRRAVDPLFDPDSEVHKALAASLDKRWADAIHARLAKFGALGDLDLISEVEHRALEFLLDRLDDERDDMVTPPPLAPGEIEPLGPEAIAADPRLARALTGYLVEKTRRFDAFGNPRLPLSELPADLMRGLFWSCAVAWREDIIAMGSGDETFVDDALEQLAATAIAATEANTERMAKASEVADALTDGGRLEASVLAHLLHQREVQVFEAVLARLIELPVQRVRTLTFEPGGVRLVVAAHAAGVERADFVFIALTVARARGLDARDSSVAIELFDRIKRRDAERVLRHWRRRPEYLAALIRHGAASD